MVTRICTDRQTRTPRAFTLIELLAVVAILAIVGVITVVAYSGIIADVRRSSAVEQVKGLLAQTRMIALKSGHTTMLAFRARSINSTPRVEAIIAQPAGGSRDWSVPDNAPVTPQRDLMVAFSCQAFLDRLEKK